MKISKEDIRYEVERAQRFGIIKHSVSDKEIARLTTKANNNTYWIKNEGLWAFVTMNVQGDE